MSGRGCGRGRSIPRYHGGGKAPGRGNENNKTEPKKETRTLADYTFNTESPTQAANFKIARDFVLNHIKKEFGEEVATALRQ